MRQQFFYSTEREKKTKISIVMIMVLKIPLTGMTYFLSIIVSKTGVIVKSLRKNKPWFMFHVNH